MKYFWIILPALVLSVACGNAEQEQKRKALGEQVMEVHDEVMAYMGPISEKEKELKSLLEKMQSDSNGVDSLWQASITEAEERLQKAHNDMMDWMHTYEYPKDEVVYEKAMEYMEEQKANMEAIGTYTDQALARADSLLQAAENAWTKQSDEATEE